MNIWISAYLSLYITFSLWSFYDDFKDEKFDKLIVVEIIGVFSLIISAFAYGYLPLRFYLGGFAILFFIIGVTAFVVFAICKSRETLLDVQLNKNEKTRDLLFGLLFLIIPDIPLFLFGFMLMREYWGGQIHP